MNNTDFDDKDIILGLDDYFGNQPICFLKFCKCEEFARQVCEGELYANTPKYFRELELKTKIRGQGDKYELLSVLDVDNIRLIDPKSGLVMFTSSKGKMKTEIKKDANKSLVCFTGLRVNNLSLDYADEKKVVFSVPLDLINQMKEFGDYCAVIGANDLERKIKEYCDASNVQYIFRAVEYCSQQRIDRIEAFNNATIDRFIYKNEDLSFQKEFRLAVDIECPEDHFIRIGKVNSVCMQADELSKMYIEIPYIK